MRSRAWSGWCASIAKVGLIATLAGCSEGLSDTTALSPNLAQRAWTLGVPSGCAPHGAPRVVATHVQPMHPVTARLDGSNVRLRFHDVRAGQTIASVNVRSLEPASPPEGVVELQEPEATAPRSTLEGSRLVAWTTTVASTNPDWRIPLETREPLDRDDLGYQGAIIGQPAIAFDPEGQGVLAFIESNGEGFQLVATRIACSVP